MYKAGGVSCPPCAVYAIFSCSIFSSTGWDIDFTNVRSNLTVTASWRNNGGSGGGSSSDSSTDHFSTYGIGYKQTNTAFTDIAAHWAKEDIEFVVSRGLFSGTSTTTFSPNTAMTRGMFVTALGRLANADVSSYTKSSFTDVKSDAYYMGYIEWASKNSVVNGTGNGKFAPYQSITRELMAFLAWSEYKKWTRFFFIESRPVPGAERHSL